MTHNVTCLLSRIFICVTALVCVAAPIAQTQSGSRAPIDWKGTVNIVESRHSEGKNRNDIYVKHSAKREITCTFDPSVNVDGTCSLSDFGRLESDRGWLEDTTEASNAHAHIKAEVSAGKVSIGISGFTAIHKLTTDLGGATDTVGVGPFSFQAPATSESGSWSDGKGTTITWNLSPVYGSEPPPAQEKEPEDKPSELEAAFQAEGYDDWVPEAGEDEAQPGNTLTIRARVYKHNEPAEQSPKKARFRFELSGVSHEKGVCMNWPQLVKGGRDLKIDPTRNLELDVARDGMSATSKELSYDAFLVVTSYDWGGWGTLMVTAYPEGHETVSAHLEGNKSKYELAIPKDEDGNHIADSWEDTNVLGTAIADADDDFAPVGDEHQGDGLSTYEEYRGFRVQGQHIRTEPFQKDLFIWDPSDLGLGYFDDSRITTRLVKADEFDLQSGAPNPRVINFNRGYASAGAQHLLYLKNEKLEGDYGSAAGTGPGVPKTCHTVLIDRSRCLEKDEQELLTTIAHELAHGCNVEHHGDNYKIKEWQSLENDRKTWSNWRPDPRGKAADVAAQGGEESGVEQCIMRYDAATFYENANGSFRWKRPDGTLQRGDEYGFAEASGNIFCDDKKGTGVNAPMGYRRVSKAGDATKGICRRQFCVNDRMH